MTVVILAIKVVLRGGKMKKRISRILATLLTASLVISGTTTVFAASSGRFDDGRSQYDWEISGTEGDRTLKVTNAAGQKEFYVDSFCFGLEEYLSDDPDYPLYKMQTLDLSESGFERVNIDLDYEGYDYDTKYLKLPALSAEDDGLNWDQYEWEYLKNITVESGGDYTAPDGVLIESGEGLEWYPADRDAETYTVPDGVKRIRHRGFWHADNLTSVTLPDILEKIGQEAFLGCSGLRNIKIPASVTKFVDSESEDSIFINLVEKSVFE